MAQGIPSGSMSRCRNGSGHRLFGDQSQRWKSPVPLAFQFRQKTLNLTSGSDIDRGLMILICGSHMIQLPQIQQNIVGFNGFAPRMKAADASNPLPRVPVQDFEHLLFRFGRVKRSRIQLNVAAKIRCSHKLHPPD
jgi:hypothetical protein